MNENDRLWILDDSGEPIPGTHDEWVTLMGSMNHVIAEDTIRAGPTTVLHVLTVFHGVDQSGGDGPPLMFETMILVLDSDWCWRYPTRAEALAGHAVALEFARALGDEGGSDMSESEPGSPWKKFPEERPPAVGEYVIHARRFGPRSAVGRWEDNRWSVPESPALEAYITHWILPPPPTDFE